MSSQNHDRPPAFRPPLSGCVSRDRRMANALFSLYLHAFSSVSANIYRSLRCRESERAAEAIFDRMAERDLEEFRLLGELIQSLGGNAELRSGMSIRSHRTKGACAEDFLTAALCECRESIDAYQTMLGRTGDRVVRSILSKLLASQERSVRDAEAYLMR